MADFLAWSYSRLKQFLECPKQTWHCAVAPKGHPDRVEFVQSKKMLDGLEIDNALTDRISKGVTLPPKFAPYEGICKLVLAAHGNKFTQMKVALDKSLAPCGYMDWGKTWVRAVYDLAIVDGKHAFIFDWKNGVIWLDEAQLRLFAVTAFHTFPELEVIDTSYIWLRHGVTSDKTYHRRELADLWQTFLPDVERLQVSFKNQHWPAQPSRGKASCKYCPVNQAKKCSAALVPYGG